MSSLYFFTGENGFLLREERRRWKDEFSKKHGSENLLTLDGPRTSLRSLLDEVGTAPFGADKRLVILEGTPKFTKEEIDVLATAQHPDCLLIIIDPVPDKRTSAVKTFLATAAVKEFAPVAGKTLTDWMQKYANDHACALSADAIALLLDIVGEDQDMLAREIEKLCLYKGTGKISGDDAKTLSVPAGEREVWAMTSLLTRGKGKDALAFLRSSALRGGDAFGLWNMTLWLLRSVVSVSAAAESGERAPAKIAQQAGVPFPTVRNLLDPVSRVKRPALQSLLNWAADTDIALKTGGYRSSGDAPEEVQSLLDVLVMRFAGLFQ